MEKNFGISDVNSEEEIIEKLNKDQYENDKFYKIILEGTKKIELNPKRICKLVNNKNILKVKDETQINYEIDKLVNLKNLKGLFVKNLLKQMEENPEQKNRIEEALKIGLKLFE